MRVDIAIEGAVILTADHGFKPFLGSVGIKGGQIVRVSEERITPSACEQWIDGSDRILLPGLADLHCHGDMTVARGMGDALTLQEQNETFADTTWFRSLLSEEELAQARLLSYAESLLAGTTFRMENMYWSLGVQAPALLARAGLAGAAAEDVRPDFMQPDQFHTQEELQAFIASCAQADILPYLGSVSEEDFTESRLQTIRQLAQQCRVREVPDTDGICHLRQTFHLAETDWRKEKIQEEYGTTPVAWLFAHGFLGKDVLGSHVVQVSSEEIRMLAETGTSVVNTPLCEMKIADGVAPIAEMVRAGVNVCLGTDGAMWNNTSDLFREMKAMLLLQTVSRGIRSLSVRDVLSMATVNAARAVGQADVFGSIAEGMRADLILLRTDVPHMQPLVLGEGENVTSSVVFCATGADVTDVLVRGKWVVQAGRLHTLDLEELMEENRRTAEKLWQAYPDLQHGKYR